MDAAIPRAFSNVTAREASEWRTGRGGRECVTNDDGSGYQMPHPDPHGPPDRTPIKVGEVWENPVTGERATIPSSVPGTTRQAAGSPS